jgi:hypothetical protein
VVAMWSGSVYPDVKNNGMGESMQKHCTYSMHKVHKYDENVEQRRDDGYC